MEVKASGWTKARAVICPMMINLIIGSYYSYSNINPYVAHYLGKGPDDTIIVSQIWLLTQSIFAIISIKAADRFGYWMVNYVAFASFSLLNLLLSFVQNSCVFLVCYGFLSGVTIGLGYLPALYISWTYFPAKRSTVTGVILFCAGMSATLLSPLSTWIVNPNDLKPSDPQYGERVPILFRFYAIYFGSITLIACTLQPKAYVSERYTKKVEIRKQLESKVQPNDTKKEELEEKLKRLSGAINIENFNEDDLDIVHKDELVKQMGNMGAGGILMGNLTKDQVADLMMHQLRHGAEDREAEEVESVTQEGNRSGGKRIDMQAMYKKSQELQELNCPSVSAALRSTSFLLICLMAFCATVYNYFLNSNWKSYYQKKLPQISENGLALMLSGGAVANSSLIPFLLE